MRKWNESTLDGLVKGLFSGSRGRGKGRGAGVAETPRAARQNNCDIACGAEARLLAGHGPGATRCPPRGGPTGRRPRTPDFFRFLGFSADRAPGVARALPPSLPPSGGLARLSRLSLSALSALSLSLSLSGAASPV